MYMVLLPIALVEFYTLCVTLIVVLLVSWQTGLPHPRV